MSKEDLNNEIEAIQPDIDSAKPSVNPELLREVQKLAGANSLKHLFDSGLLKHEQTPPHEKVAVILSSGKAHEPRNSPLRKVSSDKLEANLSKFLEKIGNLPPPTDEKSLEKLKLKAKQIVSLMPGMKGIGADETEHITNTILKAASNGELHDLQDIVDHESSHCRNNKHINKKVEGLFEGEYPKEEPVSTQEHDDIHNYVKDNKLGEEIRNHSEDRFAEGGEVGDRSKDRVAELFPEQRALMNAHKTRTYAYLNSIRPNKDRTLPYNTDHKTAPGDDNYKQAISMAARPLSILDQVKNNSVSPKGLKNFASMHPELYDVLKQRMSDHMVKQQMENKRPDFKTRQSMSVFMGAPLESAFTPQSIQAAQSAFLLKPMPGSPQQPQQGAKTKKGTSTLGKSNASYRTPNQSAEADRSGRE